MVRLVILRLLESYFRHRWLYLLPIVFMIVMAGVYLRTRTPEFLTRGVFYVQDESLLSAINSVAPPGIRTWLTPADIAVSELNDLLETDAFVRAIIMQTDLEENMSKGEEVVDDTLGEVKEAVWVGKLGSNQIVIGANHESPKLAQQLVRATSERLIQWKIERKLNESQVAQSFFSAQIQEYKAVLEAARQDLHQYYRTHPEPIRGDRPGIEMLEIDRLQSEINLAANRYSSALDKDENARLLWSQIESNARQTHYMIDAPKLPNKTITSRREIALNVGLIVLAGAVLSGVAVIGAALMDRSFRFPIDVQHGLYLPILAIVPRARVPETAITAAVQSYEETVVDEEEFAKVVA